jgi:hypothetical protein
MIGRGKKEGVAAVLEKDPERSKLQGKKGPKTDEVLMGDANARRKTIARPVPLLALTASLAALYEDR